MQKITALCMVILLVTACTKQNNSTRLVAYIAIGNTYPNVANQYCLKDADSVLHTSTGSNFLLQYDTVKAGKVRLYVIDKSTLNSRISYDTVIELLNNSYTTLLFPTNHHALVISDNDQQNIAANFCKVRLAVAASDIINAKIHVTLTGTPLVYTFSNRFLTDYKTLPSLHQLWGIPSGSYQMTSTMADVNTTALQTHVIQGNPYTFNSKSTYTLATNIYADTLKRYVELYLFKHN